MAAGVDQATKVIQSATHAAEGASPGFGKTALALSVFSIVPAALQLIATTEPGENGQMKAKRVAKGLREPAMRAGLTAASIVMGQRLAKKLLSDPKLLGNMRIASGSILGTAIIGEGLVGAMMGIVSGAIDTFKTRDQDEKFTQTLARLGKRAPRDIIGGALSSIALYGVFQTAGLLIAGGSKAVQLGFRSNDSKAVRKALKNVRVENGTAGAKRIANLFKSGEDKVKLKTLTKAAEDMLTSGNGIVVRERRAPWTVIADAIKGRRGG